MSFTATLTIGQMIIARNEPKSAATNCVVEYVTFAIVTIFGASEAPNCGIAHCTISSVIIPAFAIEPTTRLNGNKLSSIFFVSYKPGKRTKTMFPIMMHGSITGTAEISGLCVKINENTGIITDNIIPLTNPQ